MTDEQAASSSSTSLSASSFLFAVILCLAVYFLFFRSSGPVPQSPSPEMSRSTASSKSREAQTVAEFRTITGASLNDAARFVKKFKTIEAVMRADDQSLDAFYNDSAAQMNSSSGQADKNREKKLGEIWERFKDPSDPKLITIEGTMELCQELDIDPESDPVLFCLAADLGSKATGEFEKQPFVQGWLKMPGGIDSIPSMKERLPALRKALVQDPAYFKKVYIHTFDLIKPAGSRVLPLDTAIDMWTLFVPPALKSSPSALSRLPPGVPANTESTAPPEFSQAHFDEWIAFQRKRGKAVSKDTWTLFIDFVRSIDADFKEYDEEAAWPSTIDDFVAHVRSQK